MVKSKPSGAFNHPLRHGAALRVISYNAASSNLAFADLKLRLDECDDMSIFTQQRHDTRQHQLQRDEGYVDDGKIDWFWYERPVHVPDIRSLQQNDAGVLTQLPVDKPIPDIHRVDSFYPALEETIGKSTGGATDVESDSSP